MEPTSLNMKYSDRRLIFVYYLLDIYDSSRSVFLKIQLPIGNSYGNSKLAVTTICVDVPTNLLTDLFNLSRIKFLMKKQKLIIFSIRLSQLNSSTRNIWIKLIYRNKNWCHGKWPSTWKLIMVKSPCAYLFYMYHVLQLISSPN